jgi:chromosome segregation ATPase
MSEDLTNKLPPNHESKLERVLDAVQQLTIRVDGLDRKIDQRLYDTRPIWESLATKVDQLQGLAPKVDQLQEGQARLEQGQAELQQQMRDQRQESRGLKTYLRDILRRMSIFNDTLVAIQADYRDIYDRVRGLEIKAEVNGQCDL